MSVLGAKDPGAAPAGPSPSGGPSSKGPGGIPLSMLRHLSSLTSLANTLSTNVPKSLTPQAESARTQATALWRSAQAWTEFFDTNKVSKPSDTTELRERLADNLSHFSSNYLLCFLVVAVLSVLVHPLSFLCVLVLAALYVFMFLQHPDDVQVGPLRIPANVKLPAYAAFSLLSLYATNAIGVIGSWAMFAVALSLLHAGGRASAKEPDFDSPVAPV